MVDAPAIRPLKVVAAALTVLAAPAFFVFEWVWAGFGLLAAGLLVAWVADRPIPSADSTLTERPPSLLRDLSLVAMGLGIVRSIHLAAELDNLAMVKFTLALGGAVVVPYLVSRFVYRDRAIGFPWFRDHGGKRNPRWGTLHWSWLVGVLVLGWLILPFYFISSGVYQNWPRSTPPTSSPVSSWEWARSASGTNSSSSAPCSC